MKEILNPIAPIFLFSLPRSGSTLLQRVLATHGEIATTSEPWLWLPFIYATRHSGIYTEYRHTDQVEAFEDFFQNLPDGISDYYEALRLCAENLYRKVDPRAKFFLDKTPRYSLIAKELHEIFPNGKFIYLWRNPLSVLASMIDTWGKGRWNVFKLYVDLYQGLANLLKTFKARKTEVLAINYEQFLKNPAKEAKRILDYLNLTYDEKCLQHFTNTTLNGRKGDPAGQKEYVEITLTPRDKWKTTLNTPLRKRFCRKYLEWLGDEKLELMGYDFSTLHLELNQMKTTYRYFFSDLFWMSAGPIINAFEARIFWDKINNLKGIEKKSYLG